jgi:uncharacterized protein
MSSKPSPVELPVSLPIFPLEGVVLLPGGDLPLNIFEARYMSMIKAAMAGDRLIGMIQPCPCPDKMTEGARPFYNVGCVGRISSFEETNDNRFLINLHGIARFQILSHEQQPEGYYRAQVSFTKFKRDLSGDSMTLPDGLTRECLLHKLQTYLDREGLYVDWDLAENIPDYRFYTLLAMVCPFSPAEKQALLEADCFVERSRMLKCLLDLACADESCHSTKDLPC